MKIKYGDIELGVTQVYPYTHDYGNGKTVLRISCSAEEVFESKIRPLMNYTGDIEYYEKSEDTEEYVLKNVYSNFYADFMCNINKSTNTYEIELTRLSDTDVRVNDLEKTTKDMILLMAEGMGA